LGDVWQGFLFWGKREIYQVDGVNRVTNKSRAIKGAKFLLKYYKLGNIYKNIFLKVYK